MIAQSPTQQQLRGTASDPRGGAWLATMGYVPSHEHRYTTVVTADPGRRVLVPVPFDPDTAWGTKTEHRVAGTVNGMGVRAVVESFDGGWAILLGPAWRRDCGIGPGDTVDVMLHPEGVQRYDLAPDIRAALDAHPAAGAFFDSLAQFYRNAYLRWIDGTKRRPDLRAARIAELVQLLEAGHKQRPRSDG